MKILYRLGVSVFIGLFLSATLSADEINVTSFPNPVVQGQKIRFTLEESLETTTAQILFQNGQMLRLSQVNPGLYSGKTVINKDFEPGTQQALLTMYTKSGEQFKVPVSFDVLVENSEQGSVDGVSLDPQIEKEINQEIRIEELENEKLALEKENRRLQAQIQTLKDDIAKLKNQDASREEIEKKEAELNQLEEQLKIQEKDLKAKKKALEKQLKAVAKTQRALQMERQELEDLAKEISNEQKLLLAQQRQTQKREQNLEKRQEKLEQKESDVSQREKEVKALQKNIDLMNQRLKTLDNNLSKEKERLEERTQEISEQEKTLDDRESLLKTMAENIDAKDRELQKMSSDLEKESDELSKLQDKIKKQEESLKEKESKLSTLSNSIQSKNKEILDLQRRLEVKQSTLDSSSTSLSMRESDVLKKEGELNAIQKELEDERAQLALLNQNYKKQAEELQSRRVSLTQDQKQFQNQELAILVAEQTISDQKAQILEISAQIESKLKESDQDQKRNRDLNQRELALISEKQKQVEELSAKLEESKRTLQLMEDSIKLKRADLGATTRSLQNQLAIIERREKELSLAVNEISALESQLMRRYTTLDELRDWLVNRVQDIQTSYDQQQLSRIENQQAINTHVEQLEGVTKVLRNRTYQLEKYNEDLLNRLSAVEWELKGKSDAKYRYSLTPYLGIRNFKDTAGYDDGGEIGIRLTEYFKNNKFIEFTIGRISSGKGVDVEYLNSYGLNLGWDYFPVGNRLDLYLLGGVAGQTGTSDFAVNAGLGLRFRFREDLFTIARIEQSTDFRAQLGFEKKLYRRKPIQVAEQDDSFTALEVDLKAPKTKIVYVSKPVEFKDMVGHWAEKDVRLISKVGLMGEDISSITDERQLKLSDLSRDSSPVSVFNPNGPVYKFEAAKMIVTAIYREQLSRGVNTKINYALYDMPGLSFYVDLIILDSNGDVINTLVKRERALTGTYDVYWDGRNAAGIQVSGGEYTVVLNIYDSSVLSSTVRPIKTESSTIVVSEELSPTLKSGYKGRYFQDISSSFWGNDIINEAEEMSLFEPMERYRNLRYLSSSSLKFMPFHPMTRIEFFTAIGKAIESMGVHSYTIPDLTPYRDVDQIDPLYRPYLQLYISQLGYGGDNKNRLNPNKLITRAEAAVVMSRFLDFLHEETP